MMQEFIKYQSLGNDFIVFNAIDKNKNMIDAMIKQPSWHQKVQRLCQRHFGIGADGILIITHNDAENLPEMIIFNADGTQAENCLNGIRCVAHFLYSQLNYPDQFIIKSGPGIIACVIDKSNTNPSFISIITNVGKALYKEYTEVKIRDRSFSGHITTIGNPHFVIEEKISPQELYTYGSLLEKHEKFPNKTNVEFFWHEASHSNNAYTIKILPFERGAGLTLACSTGAAVILNLLVKTNKVGYNDLVTCIMPGGPLVGWVDEHMSIFLQAQAEYVFSGIIPSHL